MIALRRKVFPGVSNFPFKKLDSGLRDHVGFGEESSNGWEEEFLRIIWAFEERFGHALAKMKRGWIAEEVGHRMRTRSVAGSHGMTKYLWGRWIKW